MIYNKYSTYLKKKYGFRVYRVSVDAGFGCPNKIKCIYCNNNSFNHFQRIGLKLDLKKQIETGIVVIRRRFKAEKFILYFQSGTNTNADLDTLKKTYDLIYNYDNFAGISIATRPDAVNDEILDLIASYKKDYDVCIEYGLQSIHDNTLDFIKRGHDYQTFLDAYEKTKVREIDVCVHLILGLPFETEDMIVETAKEMNRLKVDAVKLHPMHIVKNTELAKIYKNLKFNFLGFEQYKNLLVRFLKELENNIIIYGLNGYSSYDKLIKPKWLSIPNVIVREFNENKN